MHRRIESGFRHRLQTLLSLSGRGPQERAREVERLLAEARERSPAEGRSPAHVLLELYERTRASVGAVARGLQLAGDVPRFLCDPSLGGLARWLRAAGYEAQAAPGVPTERLPDEALSRGLVLLTTDTEALERRIVADGSLRLVWLPSALSVREKLGLVLRDLGLDLREPRCMACGGVLEARAKEGVQSRIPPRTAGWKDDYFVCLDCDRLFWQGTHWQRIAPALQAALAAA